MLNRTRLLFQDIYPTEKGLNKRDDPKMAYTQIILSQFRSVSECFNRNRAESRRNSVPRNTPKRAGMMPEDNRIPTAGTIDLERDFMILFFFN